MANGNVLITREPTLQKIDSDMLTIISKLKIGLNVVFKKVFKIYLSSTKNILTCRHFQDVLMVLGGMEICSQPIAPT